MLHKWPSRRDDTGWTLVELMTVIIIIGILAAIAIPIFTNQRRTAHNATVKADLTTVAPWISEKIYEGEPLPVTGTSLATNGVYTTTGNTFKVCYDADAAGYNASLAGTPLIPPGGFSTTKLRSTSMCRPDDTHGQFVVKNGTGIDQSFSLERYGSSEKYTGIVPAGGVAVVIVSWTASSNTWRLFRTTGGIRVQDDVKAVGNNPFCPPPSSGTPPAYVVYGVNAESREVYEYKFSDGAVNSTPLSGVSAQSANDLTCPVDFASAGPVLTQ
jgi:prepilin-type N-terminal cleavage/methylation domain-containing protein